MDTRSDLIIRPRSRLEADPERKTFGATIILRGGHGRHPESGDGPT